MTMHDDPMYLCGLYEAKLDALRAIIDAGSSFLGSSETKLMRAILAMPAAPTEKAVLQEFEEPI